jgi:putative acetyltransferase
MSRRTARERVKRAAKEAGMGEEISVRALEPEDMAAVAEIFNQPKAIWGTLQTPFTSLEARKKRRDGLPASHTTLVALIGGKVIRLAGLHPASNARRAHTAEIGIPCTAPMPGAVRGPP